MASASAPFHLGRFDCEVPVPNLFVFVTVSANASWPTCLFACTGVRQAVYSHAVHVVPRGQAMVSASAPFHHGRFDCEVPVTDLFVFVAVSANASWSTILFACTGVGQPVHSHAVHVVPPGQAMASASAPFHPGRFDCEVPVPDLFFYCYCVCKCIMVNMFVYMHRCWVA
jgi:hypothetical protein